MGLDVSHGAFSGSYSAFNRWRACLCRVTGGSWPPHEDATLDGRLWYWGDAFTPEEYPGLFAILNHSDCDGEIDADTCMHVYRELKSLLPAMELQVLGTGHIERDGGYREVTERFAKAALSAHYRGESLMFR